LIKHREVMVGIHWKDWIPIVYEKLKDNGVLITFLRKRDISDMCRFLENKLNMKVRHIGVWHKKNPVPQARKVGWMNSWEAFIIATKNHGMGHHYNWKEGQMQDVITTPICQGKERTEHPTQKPIALIEPLIKWWSYEKDIILDPFCGAGTTCYVARKLNRHYIGIEIDEKWIKIAKERVNKISKKMAALEDFI